MWNSGGGVLERHRRHRGRSPAICLRGTLSPWLNVKLHTLRVTLHKAWRANSSRHCTVHTGTFTWERQLLYGSDSCCVGASWRAASSQDTWAVFSRDAEGRALVQRLNSPRRKGYCLNKCFSKIIKTSSCFYYLYKHVSCNIQTCLF